MMYRDNDQSGRPDSTHAMIGAGHAAGDSLVVQTNGAAAALPAAAMPMFPTQDVLRGSMDANTFLNALRRRWLMAICMGLVVGGITAIVLWFVFPESSSATALFEVSNEPETIAFDFERYNPQGYDILKKTQLAKLLAHYVLLNALREPGISSLSVFAGEPDPIEWLQENIEVDFPQQGEILSISVSDNAPPGELQNLVNAIAKAYKDESIYQAKTRKLQTRDLLAKSLQATQKDIDEKRRLFIEMAKEEGKTQGLDRDPQTDLLLREIADTQQKMGAMETYMFELQTQFAIAKGRFESPMMIDAELEQLLAEDPVYIGMKQNLFYMGMMAVQSSGTRRGKSAERQNAALGQLKQSVAQYEAQMRAQLVREKQGKPNENVQQLQNEFKVSMRSMQNQYAMLKQKLEKAMADLNSRVEQSVELARQEAELEQLQEVAKDMAIRLESLEVEANAPSQIRQLQDAVPRNGINTAQHYSISILGGLAAFALTAVGIAYMEFRGRRLDGPEQLDEGLGIRVVGTLPSLSSRKALDPTHPVVAQLTESIDGVRTILMHDSTSKSRQVVLVTSAAAMEGRTTVASQLAASLARAGRRTLLIDGDLRRPALHSLFDVPLEDGLCEVLRAEVDVADVIRPTHAEGLWLLTAGYCDVDAIHALATEQMQPAFDKLRGEYDFIIIDGAPVLGMSDAAIFGQYCDGAILSVRRDHSQMPKINQAAELLRSVGIRIIGSVVNGVPTKADDRIIQMRLIAPKSERQLEPAAN